MKKLLAYIWILTIIVLVGIFLRTYNLHSWLKFRVDQVHDASLVSQVVSGKSAWPLMGPFMSHSGDGGDHNETNSFHIGPIYYYFQIISAKIFGNYADKMAYPDVFFAILSIPMLFFFLRIYFRKNLSLGITGLYAISAYFVQYSRFAWNTNLIPFFVLLFLFSLHKFLEKNEKTAWTWVILLGIAIGVGVQLHAIIMLLFPIVAFCVLLFSLKKNYQAWKKWAVVFLAVCVLNAPQIYSELATNFSNTRILFNFSSRANNGQATLSVGKLTLIKNDIDCNVEANAHFLASYGSNSCSYNLLSSTIYEKIRTRNFSKAFEDLIPRIFMLTSIIFSVLGYFLLFRYNEKESEDSKKYFLRLIILYVIISFIIMIPLGVDKFNDLRYYTTTFFVPYVFLGFLINFISEKFSRKQIYIIFAIFGLLILTNITALVTITASFLSGNRTCGAKTIVIGELESVAEYMMTDSNGQKLIYFGGDKTFKVIYKPLDYILRKHDVASVPISGEDSQLLQDKISAYTISCGDDLKNRYPYKKIGGIYVYRLNN